MQIAIVPYYGSAAARPHWHATLAQQVDFQARAQSLSDSQSQALQQLHPEGKAHFWGAASSQDANVARLQEGDFVLFTGKSMVRGIGEVGVRFQNQAFADSMWTPDPDRGLWRNVYSLQSFTPVEIPYDTLRGALETSPNDNFMGMRVVADPEKVAAVTEAFGLASQSDFTRSVREAEELLTDLGSSEIVDLEANNTSGSTYTRTKAEITFNRAESALVEAYRKQLPEDADVQRLRVQGRLTDLYVRTGGEAEMIEAKSGSSNAFVRQALAQSLDYATNSDMPVTRVSALFPSRPAERDVNFLHRFGIDCISRTSDGTFTRDSAPEASRQAWQATDQDSSLAQATEAAPAESVSRTDGPVEVTVYAQPNCMGCAATERALKKADVAYEKIDLSERPDLIEMFKGQGLTQAPVVTTSSGDAWSGYNPSKLREHGLDHRSRQQRNDTTARPESDR